MAGGLAAVPGVRGGAPGQDPEEGPRRGRRRIRCGTSGPSCRRRDCCWRIAGSSWRSRPTGRGRADRTSRSPSAARGASTWRSRGCTACRTRAASAASLLAKLRQLPPSAPNAVLFATDAESAAALDVDAATRMLRSRADAKDESVLLTRGFDGARGFYERYLRLSAVFVSAEGADGDARATIWVNRSARIAMPEPAARACLRCLRGDLEAAPHLHSEP